MSGMAEVLAAHAFVVLDLDQRGGACFCGDEFKWRLPTIHSRVRALSEHQASMLTAAGFGPVKEAAAMALEEAAAVMDKSAETMVAVWAEMPMTAPAAATLSAIRHEARRVRASAAAVRGEG